MSVVGIGDGDALHIGLDGDQAGLDILVVVDGLVCGGEGLMLGQVHLMGVGNQGVARDARDGLVSLGHAAVDDDQPPLHLDGALPFFDLDGDVAVDDDRPGVLDLELLQHQTLMKIPYTYYMRLMIM